MKKSYLIGLACIALGIGLSGCQQHKETDSIKLGVMSGPESALMETAQQVAKQRYGLKLKLVSFADYNLPNEALNNGDIDANMFQHVPFLDAQIKSKGYKLIVLGKGFVYPMGVYSKKLQTLNTIGIGGKLAVPNDPSNEARALLLFEKAGLIKLRSGSSTNATVKDIVLNPKHLEIHELDTAQLPRSLDDVDAAAITNNFAAAADLKLSNAIFKEGSDSPYVNVLVVREADKNNPKLQQLLAAFQSQEVVDKAQQLFADGAIAAFKVTKA